MEVEAGGLEAEQADFFDLWDAMQDIFARFDKDGSGDLDEGELAQVLKQYARDSGVLRAREVIMREVAEVLKSYDRNHTNTLDFTEFMCMVSAEAEHFKMHMNEETKAQLAHRLSEVEADETWGIIQEIFEKYDTNNSGDLDSSELVAVLKDYGKTEGKLRATKALERELAEALQDYDKDGTQSLDLHELIRMVCEKAQHFKFRIGDAARALMLKRLPAILDEAEANGKTEASVSAVDPSTLDQDIMRVRSLSQSPSEELPSADVLQADLGRVQVLSQGSELPLAQPLRSLMPAEQYWGEGDANRIPVRPVGYSKMGGKGKVRSEPSFYSFMGMDMVASRGVLKRVADRIELMAPPAIPPDGCPLPALIVVNMQVPRDAPSMMNQKLNGPTTNMILYFGLKEETAQAAAGPREEYSNALQLNCKYWAEFAGDRALQETLKLMAFCRNIKEIVNPAVKMFKSWNGKPVLVSRSGTVYTGHTRGGLKYGGVDVNCRHWAFMARKGLKQCAGLIPQMVIQVAFVIEGDHKQQGGECDNELPEQVIGTCLCQNMPDVVHARVMEASDFFPEGE